MVLQLISGVYAVAFPLIAQELDSVATIGVLSGVFTLLSAIGFVAAIALLASAVALAARPAGSIDLSRPGAPPSGYTGSGYPPAGGGSPYAPSTPPEGPSEWPRP